MSWSWSHTNKAYQYAESKLHKMSQTTLAEMWAEWKNHQKAQADALAEACAESRENGWLEPDDVTESRDFDQDHYAEKLKEAKEIIKRVGKEALADDVWRWASDHATCTNGGWRAHMCPYGCPTHMVPFSKEKHGHMT